MIYLTDLVDVPGVFFARFKPAKKKKKTGDLNKMPAFYCFLDQSSEDLSAHTALITAIWVHLCQNGFISG